MYINFTTNTTETITLTGKTSSHHLHVSGTFGSGTLQISFIGEDGNTHPISNGSFTSNVDNLIEIPMGSRLVVELSGASSPDLYFQITPRVLGI